ncbi:MAG TPA: hypothetical protein VM370_03460 [Candidatus Thermoplasmatota archaeon]|nr:hypothetical protein [Candidatus Thermoplasmatota archaeon]
MANFGHRGAGGGGYDRAPQQGTERKRMLDLRREGHFRYDLKDVLAHSSLPPEQVAAFAATIFSKGSRQSTLEAKDWVTAKLAENVITKQERDAINTLIDRYSKWR